MLKENEFPEYLLFSIDKKEKKDEVLLIHRKQVPFFHNTV